jgi:hypothetical protein
MSQKQRASGPGIPSGFERLLHPPSPPLQATSTAPEASQPGLTSRFRLHIRQQPVAARACAAGEKDRRPIDPPPILQLLAVDFDPESEDERAMMKDPRFTVGCFLYSVRHGPLSSSSDFPPGLPGADGRFQERLIHSTHVIEPSTGPPAIRASRESNVATPGQSQMRSVQVLSGRTYASPFYVSHEPDPDTAPGYPFSNPGGCGGLQTRLAIAGMPATFFIFADLSVRTAGIYRLQFRLMNWGAVLDTEMPQPILAEVWSDPFRVYSSKDFPGMRDSSLLTIKLRELGVMELKHRTGKGKGRGRKVDSDASE